MEEQKPLVAKLIIEMIGSPKEHIEKALRNYIETVKKESKPRGIEITKEDFVPAEQKGKLFSCFVELEAKFKGVPELIEFCFDAMPSSVDIMEPDRLVFDTKALTDIINDLQARLHQVDMAIKYLRAEKTILDTNVLTVFNNFIRHILKSGDKKIDELGKLTGVKPEQLKAFLDKLIEKKIISEKDGTYSAEK